MGLNHDGDVVDEVIALAVGTIENHGTSGKSKKGEHCKAMDWKSSENYTENIVNPGFYSRNMGLSCRSTCRSRGHKGVDKNIQLGLVGNYFGTPKFESSSMH